MDIKRYSVERKRSNAARRDARFSSPISQAPAAPTHPQVEMKEFQRPRARKKRGPLLNFLQFFKKVWGRLRRLSLKKKLLLGAGLVLLAVVAATIFFSPTLSVTGEPETASSSNATSPEYETVIPDGKSIRQLGGWKRVSPPEGEPVFAYDDTINTVPVSVSQQPLPKPLRGNSSQVAELAKKFNANTVLEAGDIDVYIGLSAQGPQSVIFAKNDLLVLIKSKEKIDDSYWIEYVKSLGLK